MLEPVTLVGEQKKVLTLNHNGPIQIKGAAGSGKTTVAIYRAFHLMDTHGDLFEPSKVIIFTFNKALSQYLEALSSVINKGQKRNIKVTNFHSWAFGFLSRSGVDKLYDKTVLGRAQIKLVQEAVSGVVKDEKTTRILSKQAEFFVDEISWLKGKCVSSIKEYLDLVRSGRGSSDRVTTTDKYAIWNVYEAYQAKLKELGKVDYDDYALLCLGIIEQQGESFEPLFTHIVVDEAQDLNKAQLSVLKRLVSPTTDSISIIADAAQRIYKSGFTWKEIGINVSGARTVEFRKNYRNTAEIAEAALSLLSHDDDNADFTKVQIGSRSGPKPLLKKTLSEPAEIEVVVDHLKMVRKNHPKHSICILHRTNAGLDTLEKQIKASSISCERMSNKKVDYSSSAVKLSTMLTVKGLEFDHVVITGLSDDQLPSHAGSAGPDDELHVTTERRLLYTCMTRARETLMMTYVGNPSRYLTEIDSALMSSG